MTDPNQGANINLKAGYRNFFRLFDTTTIEINKSLSERKNSFNFKIDFPYFFYDSDFSLGFICENRNVYKNL